MVKALLLDVMDTLVEDPFYTRMPAFFGCDMETLWDAKSYDVWTRFERGLIDDDEYHRTCFHDGRAFDYEAMKREMVEGYRFLDGVEPLLEELRDRGVKMVAVSNYPKWWRLLDEKLQLSRFLTWGAVSSETGVRKPDDGAYEAGASAAGCAVDECAFVDDQERNCMAARRLGMRTHVYENTPALRGWLQDVELL
jgi:HAD superfamily hydrolase (TIGR01509 family)